MIAAARVASTFKLDPLRLLEAPLHDWLILVAAHNVVEMDEAKRHKAQQA